MTNDVILLGISHHQRWDKKNRLLQHPNDSAERARKMIVLTGLHNGYTHLFGHELSSEYDDFYMDSLRI